jgi:hypothetical protein
VRAPLVLALTTACGRFEFDVIPDGGASSGDVAPVCADPVGHDEDGDGIADACDVCPHLAFTTQLDADGDRIGDACDPEPANPRQALALFATMRPSDQPFTPFTNTGMWMQLADAFACDGNGYGGFDTDLPLGNTVISMGVDVIGQTNGPDIQHQIQLYPEHDNGVFTEVGFNGTGTNNVPDAALAHFDGVTFNPYLTQPTASGIHAGAMTITGTWIVGASVALDAGWSGEPYHVDLAPFASYQGGMRVKLDSNNVAFAVTWVHIVGW